MTLLLVPDHDTKQKATAVGPHKYVWISAFRSPMSEATTKKGAHNIKQKVKCIKVFTLALIAKHVMVDLKLVLTTILSRKLCSLFHFSYCKASVGIFSVPDYYLNMQRTGLKFVPAMACGFSEDTKHSLPSFLLAGMTLRLPNVYWLWENKFLSSSRSCPSLYWNSFCDNCFELWSFQGWRGTKTVIALSSAFHARSMRRS